MNSESNVDKKAQRMNNIDRGTMGALYDLTYDSTKIIDRLYLGNSCNARNYYELEKDSIGLIVNSSPCISNYFKNIYEYYNLEVEDISGADIFSHLGTVVDTMHQYLEDNPQKGVFVHCFMGSSRSATIIIAYLMKYHKYKLTDALEFVKSKREVVNLNKDFFTQLGEFDKIINNT
tara:strand:- start:401 stop:928 length:528 start_codon:yes stop_codon:yes gene_type:complete